MDDSAALVVAPCPAAVVEHLETVPDDELRVAETPETALAILEQHTIDCLVCDADRPQGAWNALVDRLRRHDRPGSRSRPVTWS